MNKIIQTFQKKVRANAMKTVVSMILLSVILMTNPASGQMSETEPSENTLSRFSIGIMGGLATGNMDINSKYSGVYGGNIRYSFNPVISLQANVLVGELVSDDVVCDLFDPSFTNRYINTGLQAHVNMFPLLSRENAPRDFKIYSLLGAGIFQNDVEARVENTEAGWEDLTGANHTDMALYFQFGLGAKVKLSRRIDLFTQFEYHITNDDQTDGFSNHQLRGTDLANGRNDHFVNFTAGLQFKFGSSEKNHADWSWKPAPAPAQSEPDNNQYEDRIEQLEEELGEQEDTIERLYDALSEMQNVTSVEQVDDGVMITFDNSVLFDFDSSTLKSDAILSLNHLSEEIENEQFQLTIVGHTCNIGTESYNQNLSEERANSVASYLMQEGFDGSNITSYGEGESNPKFSNDTEETRAMNRRVEIFIEQ